MLRNKPSEGIRPRFTLRRPGQGADFPYSETFPFRRHWPLILILAVFDIVFTIPAFTTFREAVELWQQPDDLFNLVAALFITFWLLGWSIAPILMTSLLVILLFGREQIRARPGELEISLGLPFIGIGAVYNASAIRNLRIDHPGNKSGKSWRGSHAAFDYGSGTGEFGSNLQEAGLRHIRERIETFTGVRLRSGEATPDELIAEQPQALRAPQATPLQQATPATLASASSLLLIAANLLPIVGALFWDWELAMIMLLYWAESAVIGFFNLLKMIVIGKWSALITGPFFVGHFGGFMAVHFLFLYSFFIEGPASDSATAGNLSDVASLFIAMWPALLALFVSHGYSFFHNFLGRREYVGRSIKKQMSEPYSRIIFMHLVIIFGGGLSMMLGDSTLVLMGVIVVKTIVDLRAHLKQHRTSEQ